MFRRVVVSGGFYYKAIVCLSKKTSSFRHQSVLFPCTAVVTGSNGIEAPGYIVHKGLEGSLMLLHPYHGERVGHWISNLRPVVPSYLSLLFRAQQPRGTDGELPWFVGKLFALCLRLGTRQWRDMTCARSTGRLSLSLHKSNTSRGMSYTASNRTHVPAEAEACLDYTPDQQ